jgi:hypothetical protein
LPAAAEEISFDAEPEKEEWPEAIPLQTINKDDY